MWWWQSASYQLCQWDCTATGDTSKHLHHLCCYMFLNSCSSGSFAFLWIARVDCEQNGAQTLIWFVLPCANLGGVNRLFFLPCYHCSNGQQLQPHTFCRAGEHATTQLCLEKLMDAGLQGKSLIDYGTGSGILAIAALLLGAKRAVWGLAKHGNFSILCHLHIWEECYLPPDICRQSLKGTRCTPGIIVKHWDGVDYCQGCTICIPLVCSTTWAGPKLCYFRLLKH